MCYIFELLTLIIEDVGRSGISLYFTKSRESIAHGGSHQLANMARKARQRGDTNIDAALGKVLSEYPEKLKQNKAIRPLSVYVLTDATWSGGGDSPAGRILTIVETLTRLRLSREQFGIQFILFGDYQNQQTEGPVLLKQMDDMKDNMDLSL